MTEELRAGPFLSHCGISLCNVTQKWVYKIAVSRLEQLSSQVQLAEKRQKELEDMLKAAIDGGQSSRDTLTDVFAILNEIARVSRVISVATISVIVCMFCVQLNKNPPAAAPTIPPLQQNLNERK